MLIAIDIGNTNVVLGAYEGGDLARTWRLATDRQRTADEYGVLCRGLLDAAGVDRADISGVAITSVVPSLDPAFRSVARTYLGVDPFVVDAPVNSGMPILCDAPAEVGTDRVVSCVAAFARYGGPCIVADFGTATTFDAVSAQGEFLGGAICPGLGLVAEVLVGRTAKLPRVEVRRPERVVGTSTVRAMQAGVFYGYVGLADGILRRMRTELGGDARVVATGGFAELLCAELDGIEAIEPNLTLEGVRLIYERNQESGK
jgi:type III pantothenate kinase